MNELKLLSITQDFKSAPLEDAPEHAVVAHGFAL